VSTGFDSQIDAYAAFGSALEAAGAACLADAGEEAGREELRAAARAGLAVFELAGTVESSVTQLESGDEERFVDTSAANQWTYVRALYAALAADDDETVARLVALNPSQLRSDQMEVSPALDAVAGALRVAFGAEPGEDVKTVAFDAAEQGDRYWMLQLAALGALGDRDAFERALEPVADAEREYYGKGSPEGALLLPVRGLRAVAERV
jgi:hypothetical protein